MTFSSQIFVEGGGGSALGNPLVFFCQMKGSTLGAKVNTHHLKVNASIIERSYSFWLIRKFARRRVLERIPNAKLLEKD